MGYSSLQSGTRDPVASGNAESLGAQNSASYRRLSAWLHFHGHADVRTAATSSETIDIVREAPPTAIESAFFECLRASVPEAQDWYHADQDGTPWMTASYDDNVDGVMATWRVDFDGLELVGGRSPSNLNWDDGVRGRETGMPLDPPRGLVANTSSADEAAQIAADWFHRVTEGRASS